MTIVEFLTARLDEREALATAATPGPWRHNSEKHWRKPGTAWFEEAVFAGPAGKDAECIAGTGESDDSQSAADARHIAANDPERVLADIAAKRAIIELHKQWPILVEGPTKFDQSDASGLDSVAFKMSQQIAWMTEQEYRNRFGDEPPTAPMMRALASVDSDHPDYQQEWAIQPSVRSSSTS